jgi:antirestriction protein ArdC
VPPWRRPWGGINTGSPANAASKKNYRGINSLILGCQTYDSRWWATYRQWREIGGQVRRGEHGTRIVFWKPIAKEVITDLGETETEEFLLLREYTVFNVEQVEGKPIDKLRVQPGRGRNKEFADFGPAEQAIQATKARIDFGGNKAFYRPDQDFIQLPAKSAFESEVAFYSTLAHEVCHWTGHESRLDRLNKNARFGDAAYAYEELVAEIGGCFLCNELNIPQSDDLSNHQAYLGHWLRVLQQDHGAILRAAGQASKAVAFILSFSRKVEGEEQGESVAA